MIRKIFLILLFITGVSFSQTPNESQTVKTSLYAGVKEFSTTFTDVDSVDLVSGMSSATFDWSDIATSTSSAPSFRFAYTTSSANDTVKCLLYGYDPLTGNSNLLDTLGLTILSTTNGGTTTYGTISLSTNGYSPYVFLHIKQKAATNDQANNGTFEVSIYGPPANTNDQRWWQR